MKRNQLLVTILIFTGILATAQVGINNQSPMATLDITAKTTNGTKPEGIIAPRLTGDQIKAGDAQYGASQIGTIIYATAAVTTASTKTAVITAPGYYYFDGSIWQKLSGGGLGSTPFINNVITKSGAGYSALLASDLTSSYNTLTFNTQAPTPSFTLTSLSAADTGKVLLINNLTGTNFLINYTDDTSTAQSYTIQNTRGVTFVWGTNGWIRGSY